MHEHLCNCLNHLNHLGHEREIIMTLFEAEMTDTFSGEANYVWVQRVRVKVPDDASMCLIVRRVKQKLGVSGMCHRKMQYSDDSVRLDLINSNICIFIEYCDMDASYCAY